MKKSTLIIVTLTLLSAGVLQAQEDVRDGEEQPSVGSLPRQAPLLLAETIPGVPGGNPVRYLPGMAPANTHLQAASALPLALISDLTNYPNPFDSRKSGIEGTTVISYQLAKDAKVTVTLYDLLGHKVREWSLAAGVNGARQGSNSLSWDGTNESGQKVSKGGYLSEIVVEAPETTVTVVRKIGLIH